MNKQYRTINRTAIRNIFLYLCLFVPVQFCLAQASFVDVACCNGNGFRFWSGSNEFKLHMGIGGEYSFGPVSDYAIKTNMDAASGRGWVWGTNGLAPVAAISNVGHMKIAGNFAAARVSLGEQINSKLIALYDAPTSWYGFGIQSYQMRMQFPADARLSFFAGDNAEIMTVKGNGNVGIGTASPNSKVVVSDGTNAISMSPGIANGFGFNRNVSDGAIFNSAISAWQFSARDDRFTLEGYNGPPHDLFTVLKNGNVGVGTVTPQWKLDVDGVISAKGQGFVNVLANEINLGDIASGDGLRDKLHLCTRDTKRMTLDENGNVGIGTTTPGSYKLAVEGKIGAREVNVTTTAWSDHVFDADYKLRPLAEVQQYIEENHHLPEVPSEKEVLTNGQNLGEMNAILLKKIEELTLYVIELKKENAATAVEMQAMKKTIQQLIEK